MKIYINICKNICTSYNAVAYILSRYFVSLLIFFNKDFSPKILYGEKIKKHQRFKKKR